MFVLVTLLPVLVLGAGMVIADRTGEEWIPLPALLAFLPLLLVWSGLITGLNARFGQLVVTIDDNAVTLKVGLRTRRVPLDQIATCGPIQYNVWNWGGWGLRRVLLKRAVIANVPGDGGRAVQLVLHDGFRVLFSARDPNAMCGQIRARAPGVTLMPG
jgi:hypothetical protein